MRHEVNSNGNFLGEKRPLIKIKKRKPCSFFLLSDVTQNLLLATHKIVRDILTENYYKYM